MYPSDRTIQHIHLNKLDEWPDSIAFVGNHFYLLILADWTDRVHETGRVATKAVGQGMSGVATWGPNCELAHDVFDKSILEYFDYEGDDIMSIWLADDSIATAVWSACMIGVVDSCFEASTGTLLCVSVGSQKLKSCLHEELQEPLNDEHHSAFASDRELWTDE